LNSEIPDWILVPLVVAFASIGAWFLVYPDHVLATFARAIQRHRITAWLFFRNASRVQITGLMYMAVALTMVFFRFQS
jgi:hypothetical protein